MAAIPFGGLFVTAGLAMVLFGPYAVGWEREPLETWARVTSVTELEVGLSVVAVGHIADDTPALVHDLVLAQRQRRTDDGWVNKEDYTQPLDLVLADGSRIRVEDATSGTRGDTVIVDGEESRQRYEGLRAGSTWLVIGDITSDAPWSMSSDYHYAGTPEAYARMLTAGGWGLVAGGIFFAAIGLLVIVAGARRLLHV